MTVILGSGGGCGRENSFGYLGLMQCVTVYSVVYFFAVIELAKNKRERDTERESVRL